MDAMIDPPPKQYVQKFIEPAKAVLVYRDPEEPVDVDYVHPANYPYFRANRDVGSTAGELSPSVQELSFSRCRQNFWQAK